MHRVLITGAGGGIGRALRETLRGVYPVLRVSDRAPLAPARDGEEVDQTDIADMAAVEKMVAGVDGIVHLGGISGENDWPVILEGNIIGIYNVFEAARRAGVQRIVFATSNHAVGFYPREEKIDHRVVPRPDSRTAIYDIAAHAVYLPNGKRLEAHSGLGRHLDDPRSVNLNGRGPTPPNVYDLVLREQLFHGVRAIRLIPAGEGKMYGRDGMLAHSYMLGPNGQSNGCVSFSNYPAFLNAFLRGEVDRLVVVERLATAPTRRAGL